MSSVDLDALSEELRISAIPDMFDEETYLEIECPSVPFKLRLDARGALEGAISYHRVRPEPRFQVAVAEQWRAARKDAPKTVDQGVDWCYLSSYVGDITPDISPSELSCDPHFAAALNCPPHAHRGHPNPTPPSPPSSKPSASPNDKDSAPQAASSPQEPADPSAPPATAPSTPSTPPSTLLCADRIEGDHTATPNHVCPDELARQDLPIRWYASGTLLADELHDSGHCAISFKARVMDSFWLVLLRQFVRVDSVAATVRDVRYIHFFGSEHVVREVRCRSIKLEKIQVPDPFAAGLFAAPPGAMPGAVGQTPSPFGGGALGGMGGSMAMPFPKPRPVRSGAALAARMAQVASLTPSRMGVSDTLSVEALLPRMQDVRWW